jgi:hypothetical protein
MSASWLNACVRYCSSRIVAIWQRNIANFEESGIGRLTVVLDHAMSPMRVMVRSESVAPRWNAHAP